MIECWRSYGADAIVLPTVDIELDFELSVSCEQLGFENLRRFDLTFPLRQLRK